MVLKKLRNIADMGPKIPPKWQSAEGKQDIFFGEVTIRVLPSTSVHNFMIKYCTVHQKQRNMKNQAQKYPKMPPAEMDMMSKKCIDHQSKTKNICIHFHRKISKGSQKIEEHMLKWPGRREEHDLKILKLFFWLVQ